MHTIHCSCILSNQINFFLETCILKSVWPCWCIGWFDAVIVSCLVSSIHFNCIVQYSLYDNMDIGTIWHCALVSGTQPQSIRLFSGCALFWCWVSLWAPVTISLIELYFVMIFIMIVVTIIGIFMAIHYFLNYTLTTMLFLIFFTS